MPKDAPTDGSPIEEIKTTTCYMCACRCGIRVHLRNAAARLNKRGMGYRAPEAAGEGASGGGSAWHSRKIRALQRAQIDRSSRANTPAIA